MKSDTEELLEIAEALMERIHTLEKKVRVLEQANRDAWFTSGSKAVPRPTVTSTGTKTVTYATPIPEFSSGGTTYTWDIEEKKYREK